MKPQTQQDHIERITTAIVYILDNLDEAININQLADRVCLSRFHFHRMFQALMGETIGELMRRLRLERSAIHLQTTQTPITELAFEAGYATHEAFIRAFRSAYGCTPSTMRRSLRYNGQLPTPNGVHYGIPLSIRFIESQGECTMQVVIRQQEPLKAVCVAHEGAYFMIGKTFETLNQWLTTNQIQPGPQLALYYHDPDVTPLEELKSYAGALVPSDFETDSPEVSVIEIEGGTYAVATHIGPYDGLNRAWAEFVGKWLPSTGNTFSDVPCLELYLDNCQVTPADQVRTELLIPLKNSAE